MDDERGDSREEVGVVEAERGGSEVEWGSRSETGRWFQRQDEAYRKEKESKKERDCNDEMTKATGSWSHRYRKQRPVKAETQVTADSTVNI